MSTDQGTDSKKGANMENNTKPLETTPEKKIKAKMRSSKKRKRLAK